MPLSTLFFINEPFRSTYSSPFRYNAIHQDPPLDSLYTDIYVPKFLLHHIKI
jgi:hypothetical protein